MKTVYVGMSADIIQPGHIYLLKEASNYGKVIVGLLTDEAIASYKRVPITTWEHRKMIIENLKMVSKIVPQNTLDYTDNLKEYKPNYVVHGEDWKTGTQKSTRDKVIKVLEDWDGELIEVPLYNDEEGKMSSSRIIDYEMKGGVGTSWRKSRLKKSMDLKPIVRIIEAHSGISGIIAETTKIQVDGEDKYFDGIWISSLTDSASKGKPDIELVDFTSRVQTIEEILEVTTKPIIIDLDTGGQIEHLSYMIRTLERLGVSAVIIEDKRYPKRNSLLEGQIHIQENIDKFCEKLKCAIQSRISNDFLIIARIESLIAGKSVMDALLRANAYIEAGADGIMIHSKEAEPTKLIEFCKRYKEFTNKKPLILVPTSYNSYTEDKLKELGASIVIYANHLLRSSYKTMKEVARMILENSRSYEVNDKCASVKEIINIDRRDNV